MRVCTYVLVSLFMCVSHSPLTLPQNYAALTACEGGRRTGLKRRWTIGLGEDIEKLGQMAAGGGTNVLSFFVPSLSVSPCLSLSVSLYQLCSSSLMNQSQSVYDGVHAKLCPLSVLYFCCLCKPISISLLYLFIALYSIFTLSLACFACSFRAK